MAGRKGQAAIKTVVAPWRNRVVRTEETAPDQLEAHFANFRIHPEFQQDALLGVIKQIGYIAPVIASERTGRVLDGHLRCMLAMREGQPTIPVTYVDVDESEELLILSTLDPLSTLAATDRAKLASLLGEVETGDAALMQMLSELGEQAGIGADLGSDQTEGQPNLVNHTQPVKIALAVDEVAVIEQALRATGIDNRGNALVAICTAYLELPHARRTA